MSCECFVKPLIIVQFKFFFLMPIEKIPPKNDVSSKNNGKNHSSESPPSHSSSSSSFVSSNDDDDNDPGQALIRLEKRKLK